MDGDFGAGSSTSTMEMEHVLIRCTSLALLVIGGIYDFGWETPVAGVQQNHTRLLVRSNLAKSIVVSISPFHPALRLLLLPSFFSFLPTFSL